MKVESSIYQAGKGWSDELGGADSERTLVFVFGAFEYAEEPARFEEVRAAYPSSEIIGCSTSGELSTRGFHTGSLSLLAVRFERSKLAMSVVELTGDASARERGKALIEGLEPEGLSAVFVLSNGAHANGSRFMEGMNEAMPEGATLSGGVASAFESFERMWTLAGGELSFDRAVAVGIYGEHVLVSHGTRGGWDPLGPTRSVTRSVENVVYELDGEPALDVYKKYLGKHADELPQSGLFFPLEVHPPGDDENPIIRAIADVDEAQSALVLSGDVPEGWKARMMRGSMDRLVGGAAGAVADALEGARGDEAVCLTVSCLGRRLVLGERVDEEYEVISELLPEGVTVAGFYSHGELSPKVLGRLCDHRNQMIAVTLISEARA